ncbi:MAG: molybdopterin converting factor subunit 1 [Burkholderiaceae bacterium]
MRVEVLFFASLREAVGSSRERIELPESVDTAGALREYLRSRGGVWAQALADTRALRIAVDQAMASPATALHDGAEVAFFPPVTGG